MQVFDSHGVQERTELVEALDVLFANNSESFKIVLALVRHLKASTGVARLEQRTPGATFEFRLEGDCWSLLWEGHAVRLKDTRGQRMLAQLVAEPHREFHACELAGREAPTSDAGELLDDAARRTYRARVESLQSELSASEARGDLARCTALESELEWLTSELKRAVGLRGRARRSGAADERARIAVQRRISAAIAHLEVLAPSVGQHLRASIRTGMYCVYWPASR